MAALPRLSVQSFDAPIKDIAHRSPPGRLQSHSNLPSIQANRTVRPHSGEEFVGVRGEGLGLSGLANAGLTASYVLKRFCNQLVSTTPIDEILAEGHRHDFDNDPDELEYSPRSYVSSDYSHDRDGYDEYIDYPEEIYERVQSDHHSHRPSSAYIEDEVGTPVSGDTPTFDCPTINKIEVHVSTRRSSTSSAVPSIYTDTSTTRPTSRYSQRYLKDYDDIPSESEFSHPTAHPVRISEVVDDDDHGHRPANLVHRHSRRPTTAPAHVPPEHILRRLEDDPRHHPSTAPYQSNATSSLDDEGFFTNAIVTQADFPENLKAQFVPTFQPKRLARRQDLKDILPPTHFAGVSVDPSNWLEHRRLVCSRQEQRDAYAPRPDSRTGSIGQERKRRSPHRGSYTGTTPSRTAISKTGSREGYASPPKGRSPLPGLTQPQELPFDGAVGGVKAKEVLLGSRPAQLHNPAHLESKPQPPDKIVAEAYEAFGVQYPIWTLDYVKDYRPWTVSLPAPIVLRIFSFLSHEELCRVAVVSKRFRLWCYCPLLWRTIDFTKHTGFLKDGLELEDFVMTLGSLIERCQIVQNLKMPDHWMSPTLFQFCSRRWTKLVQVDLSDCLVLTDELIQGLVRSCKGIRRLSLNNCSQLTEASVAAIAENLPLMNGLGLKGVPITPRVMLDLVQKCQQLENVCFGSTALDSPSLRNMATGAGIYRLRRLDLSNCILIDDSCLTRLFKQTTDLTTLDISCCPHVTNVTCDLLRQWCSPKLRNLSLRGNAGVSDYGIIPLLKKCLHLQRIDLSFTKVTHKSIMYLFFCRDLVELQMAGTPVTDALVKQMGEDCPKLTTLVVDECSGITNKSTEHFLLLFRALIYLSVDGTSLNAKAIECIRMQRPQLKLQRRFSINASAVVRPDKWVRTWDAQVR